MRKLLLVAFALAPAFAQVRIQSVPHPAASQAVQVVQAMIGISQGGQTLPCANPGVLACYGVPPGAVVVQPEMLLTQGEAEDWYAVFQTGEWMGSLRITFDLIEAGTVVQTVTEGTAAIQNSIVLVSVGEYVPTNGYIGPATMRVTTVATARDAGGTQRTLRSSVTVEISQ